MTKMQQPDLFMLTEIRRKQGAGELRLQRANLCPPCFMHLDSLNFMYRLAFFNITSIMSSKTRHCVKIKQVQILYFSFSVILPCLFTSHFI